VRRFFPTRDEWLALWHLIIDLPEILPAAMDEWTHSTRENLDMPPDEKVEARRRKRAQDKP
jgi:hypothetical protein